MRKNRAMKKNYFLYLAILVPLVMMSAAIISTLFFKKEQHSQYDFAYAVLKQYTKHCDRFLDPILLVAQWDNTCEASFYIYDSKRNTSRLVTHDQIPAHLLISGVSPDGYNIEVCGVTFPEIFWLDDKYYHWNRCLVRGNFQKRMIKLQQDQVSSSPNNFVFLGWIVNASQNVRNAP